MSLRVDFQDEVGRLVHLQHIRQIEISPAAKARARARLKAAQKMARAKISSRARAKADAKVKASQFAKRAQLARRLGNVSLQKRNRLEAIAAAGRARIREIFTESEKSPSPSELLRRVGKASSGGNGRQLIQNSSEGFRRSRTRGNNWPARFIIRTASSTELEDVRKIVAGMFGLSKLKPQKGIQLDTLFKKFRTDRYFLLTIPVPRRNLKKDRYAIARAIKGLGKFEVVQPERLQRMQVFRTAQPEEGEPDPDTLWPLRRTKVIDAWEKQPAAGGRRKGGGVFVGHPDSGWQEHPEYDQQNLDLERAYNVFTDQVGGESAKHPLDPFSANEPIAAHITHGTGLGSVIVSAEADFNDRSAIHVVDVPGSSNTPTSSPVAITGIAPDAKLVPIRCIDTVIRVLDSELATAIEYLMNLDDPPAVISISMGGVPHPFLEEIIREAVRVHNIIVVAAAGQLVDFVSPNNSVVEPGAYADVVCAAGTTSSNAPWKDTCRGPEVDISAPASGVWCADFVKENLLDKLPKPAIVYSKGTSFSAAITAGIAAMWVGFWGRDRLLEQYPTVPLGHVFRHLVRKTATVPDGWDASLFGAGIINAEALLDEGLPEESEIETPPTQGRNPFSEVTNAVGAGEDLLGGFIRAGEDIVEEVKDRLAEIGLATAAVGGFLLGWAQSESLRIARETEEFYGNLWEEGQATLEALGAGGEALVDDLVESAQEGWENAVETGEEILEEIADTAEEVAEAVVEVAENMAEGASDVAEEIVEVFEDLWPF